MAEEILLDAAQHWFDGCVSHPARACRGIVTRAIAFQSSSAAMPWGSSTVLVRYVVWDSAAEPLTASQQQD